MRNFLHIVYLYLKSILEFLHAFQSKPNYTLQIIYRTYNIKRKLYYTVSCCNFCLYRCQLTFSIEEINSTTEPVQLSKVHQNSSGVILHIFGILRTVIRVIPLVRRQQQLHQHVGNVGVDQGLMVCRI